MAGEGITRRGLLLGGGAAGLAAAAGAGAGYAAADARGAEAGSGGSDATVAFEGEHQAGVATPAQARLVFAAFDLVTDRRADVAELLRAWTDAARLMTAGRPTGPVAGASEVPPQDTGEAVGLGPAALTVTVGVAPSLFERDGEDRFGLRARRPSRLRPLGPLPGDQLDPARTDGDLCVQACSDDPQVAFHAVRNLLRAGRGRSSCAGSSSASAATPRRRAGSRRRAT